MIILFLMVIFVFGFGSLILNEIKIGFNFQKSIKSYYASEGGVEDAVLRVKNSMQISSNYNISVGDGSVNVAVSSPSQNNRVINVSSEVSNVFRKIQTILSIDTVSPSFFYGAQVGTLGIAMENNSRIEGAGGASGNVYSNGPISGSSGSTITGNVFVATGMSQDQNFSAYNADQIFGKTDPIIDMAQSFTPSVSNTLVKVSLYLKKVGNPDDRQVKILTDNLGSPTKTVLVSATLDKNLVGTAFGWVDVVFPSPPNLIAGTPYWLMVDASRDSNDYWVLGKDSNAGYGSGEAKYSQDWNAGFPVWVAVAGDLNFKTFMGGQATFLDGVIVNGDAYANTITNSKICGNGYYQTIDSSSFNFLNSPSNPTCSNPLTPGIANAGSSDPPLQNMPISDSNINQWKQDAEAGGVYNGNLSVTSDMSYGPKKINGNLIMTSSNKTLTVAGTIYVTGYIDIDNGSRIRCDATYGLNSCVILADKWVHVKNNGVFQGSGQSGSYIMILSASNCDGSSSINCTHHNAAMDLHNGATGAIFYANDGLIYLHNGVVVSELTAKKINLEQGAIIRYEQGLVNAGFSAGPGGSWKINQWKEVE